MDKNEVTERKEHIGGLFDRIAGSYDALNHYLSLNIDKRWRRQLARRMQTVEQVLDVAIGTGDLAIEIMRQGRAKQVLGIDLSEGMMNIGREKVKKTGYAIRFEQASALDMPMEDNTFDAVTCGFGTRNFSNLDRGLSEMHRVLRPGGEVLILEFSYPKNTIIRAVYNLYFAHILPTVGGWLSHDKPAYRYLNKSVEHFVWGEQFCERMRGAGFVETSAKPLTFGIATLYYGRKQ